jgi:hypothetical protein
MTCRATCGCCKPNNGEEAACYASNGANGIRNIELQQVISPILQPGYITVPMSPVQSVVNGGAMGLPTENAWGHGRTADKHTLPPKYESVEEIETLDFRQAFLPSAPPRYESFEELT